MPQREKPADLISIKDYIAGLWREPAPKLEHNLSGRLSVLQAGRGIAAVAVVLFHVNQSAFGMEKYWADKPFGLFPDSLHSGVEFFFVLSGFIIFATHRGDAGRPERYFGFLWKRFKRIYPPYWAALLIVIPVYFLVPRFGTSLERDPVSIVQSVLLVRLFGTGASIIVVGWTLFHEVLFYGLFSILVLNARLGRLVLAGWFAGSACAVLLGGTASQAVRFYFLPQHLLFGVGMVAAWAVQGVARPCPAALLRAGLLLSVAAFLATGMEEVYGLHLSDDAISLLYGGFAGLIVVFAVLAERQGLIRTPRFLSFLGDASYSIYLAHSLAISALAKSAIVLTGRIAIPHGVLFVGLAAGGVAAGSLFHLWVEAPLARRLGRRAAPRAVLGRAVT